MKRRMLVGVAGAVIVVATMPACSNSTSNTSSSGSSSANEAAVSATAVIIDGQKQDVTDQVSCTAAGDNINIAFGDPTNGVGAVVTNANPPTVHSVGLGNVDGLMLGYSDAATNQGTVQVTQSGKSYKITGTATGVDATNPQQPVTKPFEMDVTCP